MRYIQTTDCSITYPDEIVFAYNKNTITILRNGSYQRYYEVKVGDYSIKAAIYGDTTKIDISGLLKVLFDDVPNVRSKTIDVNIISHDEDGTENELLDFSTTVIFGSMALGERFLHYGAYNFDGEAYIRHIRWFAHFPFYVSYFTTEGYTVSQRTIDGKYSEDEAQSEGIHDIYVPADSRPFKDWNVRLRDKSHSHSTFDHTFDYTFFQIDPHYLTRLEMETCVCTEGWYFRWIDRRGFWMQWLFTKGTTTTKNTPSNYAYERGVEYNGMEFDVTRILKNTATNTIKCGAAILNDEHFRDVCTILTSCYVELFLGYDATEDKNPIWMPVKVEGTSVASSDRKMLNQVEIQVSFDLTSQSL